MAKILLVEDNEINRDMLTRRLSRLDYTVIVARDGEQREILANKAQPDLIVMDVGLPNMNGLQLTKILKANPETRHIPIIVLTAYTQVEDRERAFAAGCDEYAPKPIAFNQLSVMIGNLLAAARIALKSTGSDPAKLRRVMITLSRFRFGNDGSLAASSSSRNRHPRPLPGGAVRKRRDDRTGEIISSDSSVFQPRSPTVTTVAPLRCWAAV